MSLWSLLEHWLEVATLANDFTCTHRCVIGHCGQFPILDLSLALLFVSVVIIVKKVILDPCSTPKHRILSYCNLVSHLLQVRIDDHLQLILLL